MVNISATKSDASKKGLTGEDVLRFAIIGQGQLPNC